METQKDYYVYIYIDPRNYETFYVGKGKGNRKFAHLFDNHLETEKVKRIKAIQDEGVDPIIKVFAKDLSEEEAFLVEKTLIWSNYHLTNKSEGHYERNFRPKNTLHMELPEFDFGNSIYAFNVGEDKKPNEKGKNRSWEDNVKYGFVSAGGRKLFTDAVKRLKTGDIIAAYLSGHGYVGIGLVIDPAVPVKDFLYLGKNLQPEDLIGQHTLSHANDPEKCDYAARVRWIKTTDKSNAKKVDRKWAYRPTCVNIGDKKELLELLEKAFDIKLDELTK